jgi:hypothetical protein
MLLVLEVVLTVMAWRKGWGAIALLPLALAVVIDLLVFIAAPEVGPFLLIGDVICVIVLAVMAQRPELRPGAVPTSTMATGD